MPAGRSPLPRTFRLLATVTSLLAAACGADGGAIEGDEPVDTVESPGEPCQGDVASVREPLVATTGTRPLLVILLQRDAATPLSHDAAFYEQRIFGPAYPNLVDHVAAMSKDRFRFTRAAGVISVTDSSNAAFLARAGVTPGMGVSMATRLRSLMLADDAGFPFETFDTNGDGRVSGTELSVITIDNYSSSSGQNGGTGCVAHPGVQVCTPVALAGHQSDLANFGHEVLHQLGTEDVYGAACHNSKQSIMSCTGGGPDGAATLYDLDPWQRQQLGWTGRSTAVLPGSGSAVLQPVATYSDSAPGSESLTLSRGANNEVLHIENRKRDTEYDRDVAVEGVSFWYTQERADGLDTISIPNLIGDGGSERANFILQPEACVGDPMSAGSRGRTAWGTNAGGTYRFKWLDGTDTGFLFTIGSPSASGAVTVSWAQSSVPPACNRSLSGAGFAWVNLENGTVDPGYSYSTSGGPITVSSTTVGTYVVRFGNLARLNGGNTLAVAYGPSNVRCKVAGNAGDGDAEQVIVRCHDPAGLPAFTPFVVEFRIRNEDDDVGAYAFADKPTRTTNYNSHPNFSWNSTGGTNTVTRTAKGAYDVFLPGVVGLGGTVQVSAHGTSANHCKILSWGGQSVSVRCFNTAGAAADEAFHVLYEGPAEVGLFDHGAYAWANDSVSASYTPAAPYAYNSDLHFGCAPTGTNLAGRTGTGRYFMRHSGLQSWWSIGKVTAYGAGAAYCKVESWGPVGATVEVRTRCFDAAGAAADSRYVESYTTAWYPGPC